jgi:hypothetical protein
MPVAAPAIQADRSLPPSKRANEAVISERAALIGHGYHYGYSFFCIFLSIGSVLLGMLVLYVRLRENH